MIRVKYTVESDIGLKRAVNEDRVAFFERLDHFKLAILADGMGGHNAGDVASEMAVKEMGQCFLQEDYQSFTSPHAKQSWLKQAVETLNENIYEYSLSHVDCKGMGTTFIAIIIDDLECTVVHVGDSRVYHFFEDGVEQITRDHSYVNVLVDNGEISEEEALTHPKKNLILKALGTEATIEPDFFEVQLTPKSYLLVCSDGLSNKLTIGEISSILTLNLSLKERGQKLVQLANDSGGEDNISLVLLSIDEEEV